MKKDQKKETKNSSNTLLILIACIVMIIISIVVGVVSYNLGKKSIPKIKEKKEEPTIKYNTNEGIVKDKEINGILFTNIECAYDGNISLITYTIKNNTKETINLKEYEVNIKDKEGKLLAIMSPNLDKEIAPGESFDTGNSIDIDLSNAYSMELNLDNKES